MQNNYLADLEKENADGLSIYAAIDMDSLYIMTITDNLETSETKFKKLKEALDAQYIDGDGKMINYDKGLKEIRISASWIRRIVEEDDESKFQRAPVISVRLSKGKYLQYIICLPKALKAAVILSNKDYCKTIASQNDSVNFLSIDKFRTSYNRGYDIVAIKEEDYSILYPKICLIAPQRIVKLNKAEFDIVQKEHSALILYKKLSLDKKPIYIIDDNSQSEYELVIQKSNEANIEFKYANTCFYKKHLETEKHFYDLIRSLKEECEYDHHYNPRPSFAEGISGSNSTDRLIRGTETDEEWYYKHLYAMHCQIAIFDERLFYHVTNLNDWDLNADLTIEGSSLAVINAFKNIYVFNVIYNKANDTFDIYGYHDYLLQNDIVKSQIKLIGRIKRRSDQKKYEVNIFEERYKSAFNNITIHQGLLDKIYEQYECVNSEDKKNIINELYDKLFCKSSYRQKQLLKGEQYFYPGFTIHSGRSKPTSCNTLQLLPFIQYASIENAFMDCKYILVELLELAQYE